MELLNQSTWNVKNNIKIKHSKTCHNNAELKSNMLKIGQLINHKIEIKKALKYITSKDDSHGINSKVALI